jgi:hypothetical protein
VTEPDSDVPATFPMHPGARRVLAASGCVLLLIPPIGLYYLLRSRRVRVEVTRDRIAERSLSGTHNELRAGEVDRLGLYVAPLPGGAAGAGVRLKVRGNVGINLCWRSGGRTRSILLSLYDEPDTILAAAREMTGLPVEQLSMGFWGVRWPAVDDSPG